MNQRTPMQPYASNSLAIRQEIQRFESVHPSIYAIYDLIEAIPDHLIQQQIREHVVCIEDSFVNSQEWTLSRSVPDLKLGILGSIQSGKSALVHRYLTGSYMQEESPEGGRFKKEVMIDGQSYLLLIRDEGGAPEMQFTQWVDAVIFVFSLENDISFKTVYSHYTKMAHYRNPADIPLILVGTQDAICENNPRMIDDVSARKLASDLKRCTYYETCATYGLNVDRVFQDACQKIVTMRYPPNMNATPTIPPAPSINHVRGNLPHQFHNQCKTYDSHSLSSQSTSSSGTLINPNSLTNQGHGPSFTYKDTSLKDREKGDKKHKERVSQYPQSQVPQTMPSFHYSYPDTNDHPPADFQKSSTFPTIVTPVMPRKNKRSSSVQKSNSFSGASDAREFPSPTTTPLFGRKNKEKTYLAEKSEDNLNTPSSTPTQIRKDKRRSNIFNAKKGEEEKTARVRSEELGSGRIIPIKQGCLYKKSHGLKNEWKKKYVALLDDGRLTYHPSLRDYMNEEHGKEINLARTTVKIPGMRPRGSRASSSVSNAAQTSQLESNNISAKSTKDKENPVTLTAFEGFKENRIPTPDDNTVISNIPNGDSPFDKKAFNSSNLKIETPNVKKRHRRAKSGGIKTSVDSNQPDEAEDYEFTIVSLENKQWHFEAQNSVDRDEWVQLIEQQILYCLQGNESTKSKSSVTTVSSAAGVQAIRSVRGNNSCSDCGSPNPEWASLNLGALICIECSGIHRNLGTHLSRVRSLTLDEWTTDLVAVMSSIGNAVVNRVWEACTKGRPKPNSTSARDEKERWIRAKYEQREFLPPPPYVDIPFNRQLIDALVREDVHNIILLLGHCQESDINAPYSNEDGRTALHIASALGNIVYVQLLLWYSADVEQVDHEGRNSLWYARTSGVKECGDLLISYNCPEHPTRRRASSHTGKNESLEKLPASVI